MNWWEDAVGYEVYLRSYADSDGDGIGDFAGLTDKLDYIAGIGVDAVWVTPFYPSPQADFGYDVADYCDVDPVYGSLETFDRFVSRAHELGLKVVLDIVPNHSSSEHRLFEAALEGGPGSEYWDYYVWRDPAPDGGPPNNWFSIFGGPAWTYVKKWDKYYMHLFLAEQPDLNWANPAVHHEFEQILQFWVDRGVDGFRVDVAHTLLEHPSFADNPPKPDLGAAPAVFDDQVHLHDIDQPGAPTIYEEWRRVTGPDTYLVGEVYITEPERVKRYVADGGLDHSFFFGLNSLTWDPSVFAATITEAASVVPSGWGWVQGSHDEHRNVTRFGGGAEGVERAFALWVAMFGLPGTPFLYQGEELALENGVVTAVNVADPVGKTFPAEGRDPCRTPMPWTTGVNNGFTEAEDPWLICAPRAEPETVESQDDRIGSPLNRMRDLLAVRKKTSGGRRGPVDWMESPPGVMAYARDGVTHVANLNDRPTRVVVGDNLGLVYRTAEAGLEGNVLELAARSGVILEVST